MSETRNQGFGAAGVELTHRQVLSHALKLVGAIIHVDGIAPSVLDAASRMPDLASLTDGDRQAVISKVELMLES